MNRQPKYPWLFGAKAKKSEQKPTIPASKAQFIKNWLEMSSQGLEAINPNSQEPEAINPNQAKSLVEYLQKGFPSELDVFLSFQKCELKDIPDKDYSPLIAVFTKFRTNLASCGTLYKFILQDNNAFQKMLAIEGYMNTRGITNAQEESQAFKRIISKINKLLQDHNITEFLQRIHKSDIEDAHKLAQSQHLDIKALPLKYWPIATQLFTNWYANLKTDALRSRVLVSNCTFQEMLAFSTEQRDQVKQGVRRPWCTFSTT